MSGWCHCARIWYLGLSAYTFPGEVCTSIHSSSQALHRFLLWVLWCALARDSPVKTAVLSWSLCLKLRPVQSLGCKILRHVLLMSVTPPPPTTHSSPVPKCILSYLITLVQWPCAWHHVQWHQTSDSEIMVVETFTILRAIYDGLCSACEIMKEEGIKSLLAFSLMVWYVRRHGSCHHRWRCYW